MKISIFHPEGNIGNNPNLRVITETLLSAGHQVTYISNPSPQGGKEISHTAFTPWCIRPEVPLDVVMHENDLVIGIDEGIIPAARQAIRNKSPLLFISYEIFYDKELVLWRDKCVKQKMVKACKNIFCAITQDSIRAKSLACEFNIAKEKIICIPVAGTGCVTRTKNNYLYEHCNIPKDKKILLHFGSVASWSMAQWLMQQANNLPKDWVLVIHDRYGIPLSTTMQSKKRCYFSNQPLRHKNLAKIIQSATACAVLYAPQYDSKYTGRNIEEIGFSSGKLSLALQHGIPVVVNMAAHAALVKAHSCGISITPESLNPLQDIDLCSKIPESSCHDAFIKNLDFSLAKDRLLEQLERIKNDSRSINDASKVNDCYQKDIISYLFEKINTGNFFYLVALSAKVAFLFLTEKIYKNFIALIHIIVLQKNGNRSLNK